MAPGTFSEHHLSVMCHFCSCTSTQPDLSPRMLYLLTNTLLRTEDWGRGQEASLTDLLDAKLAEVTNMHCSVCGPEAGRQPGKLVRTPGRVDLLWLDRNPREGGKDVEDEAVEPTFCPGGRCREVRDEQCQGHRPTLKIPTPIARPSPTSPVFAGRELVVVLGHRGRHVGRGHWVAWVKQGGVWYLVDSLGDGSLVIQDPFTVQLRERAGQQPTLSVFAFV